MELGTFRLDFFPHFPTSVRACPGGESGGSNDRAFREKEKKKKGKKEITYCYFIGRTSGTHMYVGASAASAETVVSTTRSARLFLIVLLIFLHICIHLGHRQMVVLIVKNKEKSH